MKGQTYVILAIIFVIIISVFAVLNIDPVEVNYLFWSGSSPLIFVILFSVLLGGILTTVVGSKKYYHLKKEVKQLKAELAEKGKHTKIHSPLHKNKTVQTGIKQEKNDIEK